MKQIPAFIYRKSNQIIQISFVPVFAFLFQLIYRPTLFNDLHVQFLENWGWSQEIISSVIFLVLTLVGTGIVAISRVVMNAVTKKRSLSYAAYIAWVAGEIVTMALIYTIAAFIVAGGDIISLFKESLYKTILVLMIPYVITYILFILWEKTSQLKIIRKQMEEDDKALVKSYVKILDEKGELRLSVKKDNLLFIEAEDNYVCVWYLSGKSVKNLMVRNSLKKVQEQLQDMNIVRCHRSYMVNVDHIKILRREKEGFFFIDLGFDGVPDIPMSKTYGEEITNLMMK